MENRLRLAEARGSLTAPNNPVQDLALQILLVLKAKAEEDQRIDALRNVMLVANPPRERVAEIYPEYFPREVVQRLALEDAVDESGEFDIDRVRDADIEWKTEVTPEEDEDIANWIAQRERGQMSLAELEGGWV